MLSATPFPMSSEYRDSEDLYTIVSAYSTSTNCRAVEKRKSMVQSKTSGGKRSWTGAIRPSLQEDDQGLASTKKSCLDHKAYVCTERVRSKMNCMLSTLKSLIPEGLNSKVDKGRIVDKANDYIKSLQANLKDLQAQQSELEAHHSRRPLSFTMPEDSHGLHIPPSVPVTSSYPGLKILGSSVLGGQAFITILAPEMTGVLPKLFFIMEANQLQIVNCTINVVGSNILYALHVMSKNNNEQITAKVLSCTTGELNTTIAGPEERTLQKAGNE